MERVLDILVLLNIHFIVLNQNDSSFVVVLSAVVGGGEHRDDRGESRIAAPPVHLIAVNLNLMCTDNRDEVVAFQDGFDRLKAEFHGALPLDVLGELDFAGMRVVAGVGPQQVAEEAVERGLDEPVEFVDIFDVVELRGDSSMHAEVVSVDIGCQGHGLKGVNKQFVEFFVTEFMKDFSSKCEMLSHGAAFVISTQHDDIFRVVNLQKVSGGLGRPCRLTLSAYR